MAVSFEEVQIAFDFVSYGQMCEHNAVLCKETGKIYYQNDASGESDELPDDVDEGGHIRIPHKNELDLGKQLCLDFAYEYLPDEVEKIQSFFYRRGAYVRFRDLLEYEGRLEQWNEFESKAQEEALREWCKINSIDVT